MNSQKLSRLNLGVFTTAVALTLLLASPPNHQETKGGLAQTQLGDGSGPLPQSQKVLFADGSGPVPPPSPSQNVWLADGSGPVPPPSPSGRSLNFVAI